jgi:hypothetical protein
MEQTTVTVWRISADISSETLRFLLGEIMLGILF